jgi:hypothetical protein
MASAAPIGSLQSLWRASFDTYFDAFFEELLAAAMIGRWSKLDDLTKVIVALTASGSAVTGWAVWTHPGAKVIWGICSGAAALLSVVHSSLGISTRIKSHAEDQRRFSSLRTDLETFRYKMQFQETLHMAEIEKEFFSFRQRYSENLQVLTNDTLRTRKMEIRTHFQVEARLKNEIQPTIGG